MRLIMPSEYEQLQAGDYVRVRDCIGIFTHMNSGTCLRSINLRTKEGIYTFINSKAYWLTYEEYDQALVAQETLQFIQEAACK